MAKRILLTLPESFYKKLKAEKSLYVYDSLQQMIIEILRERYFRSANKGGGKRGRPRKIDEFRIMARKKIFRKGW